MTKVALFAPIREKYNELEQTLKGNNINKIKVLSLEVHMMHLPPCLNNVPILD